MELEIVSLAMETLLCNEKDMNLCFFIEQVKLM
jgi:hypothetical protein